jgi:hypothetical protein
MKGGDPSPPKGSGARQSPGPQKVSNDIQTIPKPPGARKDIDFMLGRRPVTEFPDHALLESTKPITVDGVEYAIEMWFTFRGRMPDFVVGRLVKKEEQA